MPPRAEYAEVPHWGHNFDNVEVRIMNAGWNALFTKDLCELSFKEIAAEVGVTAPALYRYFKTVPDLGAELANIGFVMIQFHMREGLEANPTPTEESQRALRREILSRYQTFGEKRPRHLALMFSPQYADSARYRDLAGRRSALFEIFGTILEAEIDRTPNPSEVHLFWSLVHGSAVLNIAGQTAHPAQLMRTLQTFFDALKAP